MRTGGKQVQLVVISGLTLGDLCFNNRWSLCLMPHLPMCIQKHVCQFGYTYSIAYGGKCEIHPILLCHPHIACGHFRHFTSKGVFLIYWLYHYISPGIVFINDASWSTWCYFIICINCILLYILCFIPWTGQELTSIKMIYISKRSPSERSCWNDYLLHQTL